MCFKQQIFNKVTTVLTPKCDNDQSRVEKNHSIQKLVFVLGCETLLVKLWTEMKGRLNGK